MATLIRGDGRTVNAYQDSILGDFAFSGKDGIVKNVGQACGLDTTTLNSVKVKSGMVVIQGRQITLDGTDSISLPVATGSTVYWTTLYLELDLSAIADDGKAGKVTLKKLEYTSSYPAVPTSDNLKIQTAGKAYIGLYRFKNTANGVNSVESIAETIDGNDIVDDIVDINNDIKGINTDIDDINRRLDELGFKVGSISGGFIENAPSATLTKQAKYAILKVPQVYWYETTATMSFTAKERVDVPVMCVWKTSPVSLTLTQIITIEGNTIKLNNTQIRLPDEVQAVQIGFEIE